MACDNILFYSQDGCATNYAGVAADIMIVPMSPNMEAGVNNRAIIQEWMADNASINHIANKSFRSLRLPADHGEEDAAIAKLMGGIAVEINPLKSSFSSVSSGPKRGKMFQNDLKVVLIGRSLDDVDLITSLVQANQFGVVFKDGNGNYRLLADLDFPVDAQVDDQSGEGPTAEAAATITFSHTTKHPPFFYCGLLAYGVSFDPKDSVKTIDCLSGLEVIDVKSEES